jgi:5'(3')-deoxyribonucleotidase
MNKLGKYFLFPKRKMDLASSLPLVVGVDVDDVLRETNKRSIELFRKYRDPHFEKTFEEIKEWNIQPFFNHHEDIHHFLFRENGPELFSTAKPMEGAKEAIGKLKELGHTILIVSHQVPGMEKHTLKWLSEHKIPYDGCYFGFQKHLVRCDVLIDDKIENLESMPDETIKICFSRPWNKDWKGHCISSWNQI